MGISKKLMTAGGGPKNYALIGKGLELDVTVPNQRYKRIEVLKVTPSGDVSLHQEYDTETDPSLSVARVSNKGAVRVSPDNQYVAVTSTEDSLLNIAYDSFAGKLSPAGAIYLISANGQKNDGLDLTWHPDSQEVVIARNDPNINSNSNEAFTRYTAGPLGPSRMGRYNDSSNIGNEGLAVDYIPNVDPVDGGGHRLAMWGDGFPYSAISVSLGKSNSIDLAGTDSDVGAPLPENSMVRWSPYAKSSSSGVDAIAMYHQGNTWSHRHVTGPGNWYQKINQTIQQTDGRFAWIPHPDSNSRDCHLISLHNRRISVLRNQAFVGTDMVGGIDDPGNLWYVPEDVAVSHDGMVGACTFKTPDNKRVLVIVDLSTQGEVSVLSQTITGATSTDCRMEFAKDFIGT